MLNTNRIQSNIYGLVGYAQPIESLYAIVDAVNNESRSGKFFQGFSFLTRIENLRNAAPEDLNNTDFNLWLTQTTKEGLINACQNTISAERDLLEHRVLYHYEKDFNNKISNTAGRFVGYEFELVKKESVTLQINTLITSFDGEVTFNLYLYHSSQKQPIKTIELTTQIDSDLTQSLTDCFMYYQNEVYIGGKFYLGYYQDDLGSVQAYDRQYELSDIENWFTNVRIEAIRVDNTTGTDLFDVNFVRDSSETWGLNFDISIYKDYTQFLIDNQRVIQDLIGLQTAVQHLNYMEYNYRNNDIDKRNAELILLELKGLPGKTNGLEERLEREIMRVQDLLFPKPRLKRLTLN